MINDELSVLRQVSKRRRIKVHKQITFHLALGHLMLCINRWFEYIRCVECVWPMTINQSTKCLFVLLDLLIRFKRALLALAPLYAIGLFCVCVCVGKGVAEERFCLFILLRRLVSSTRSAWIWEDCVCATPLRSHIVSVCVFLCAPLIAYQQQPMEKQPDEPKVSFFSTSSGARTGRQKQRRTTRA